MTTILRIEDRAAEVAGERRTENRARIIPRKACEAVGSRTVLGRVKFPIAVASVARLQRIDQGTADADADDKSGGREHLAGETSYAWRFSA